MIACTQANVAAVAKLEKPTLRHFMQGFHLSRVTCDGPRWTLNTREGVTLSVIVNRHHGRLAVRITGGIA